MLAGFWSKHQLHRGKKMHLTADYSSLEDGVSSDYLKWGIHSWYIDDSVYFSALP